MLKEYSIANILGVPNHFISYFVGTFEGTEDPDIEWPHRHSFYSLVWFTHGSGFYVVDFQEYPIKPNRIFLVNTKQIHNWEYSSDSKGYILMVDACLGLELGIDNHRAFVDVPTTYIQIMESCFMNLIHEFGLKDEVADTTIKLGIPYLYSILNRLSFKKETNFHHTLLDDFKMVIFEENFKTSSIEYYAEKLKVTTQELNEICKHYKGISSKQYIIDLKITEAKRLLLFSEYNVNEIAYKLGFEDPSYFSRIFKKKTDFTPSTFLEKYRKQK